MTLHNVAAKSAFIMTISFQVREKIHGTFSAILAHTQILCLILGPSKNICRMARTPLSD